jgi:hypothetical protein
MSVIPYMGTAIQKELFRANGSGSIPGHYTHPIAILNEQIGLLVKEIPSSFE